MSSEGQPTIRLADDRERWDYRIMSMEIEGFFEPNFNMDELQDYLDDVGDKGWELINIVPIARGQGQTSKLVGVLKRKRR